MRNNSAHTLLRIMVIPLLSFLAMGCSIEIGSSRPVFRTPPLPPQPQTPLQLQQRYDAAMKITAFPDRDESLSAIATDAACSGDSQWAWKATKDITAFPTRDAAASSCAEQFNRIGRRDVAEQFADSIVSFPERDQCYKILAREAPSPPPGIFHEPPRPDALNSPPPPGDGPH